MLRFIALLCCMFLLAGCAVGSAADPAKPKTVKVVAPKYTPEAKAAGIQGIVRLSVEVDAQGRASSVTLLKSLDPGLDKNAIEAVKQWKWAPTIKDGKAVPVMTEVDINFSLQK